MMNREKLGKLVRQIWINYCRDTGDTKPNHLATWDEISESDREVDRQIGEQLYQTGYRDGQEAKLKEVEDFYDSDGK